MADKGAYDDSVWLHGSDAPAHRPRKGVPPLSRERLAEAAVALLDRDGLARFSMRALAAELSVSPMTAYWYVETKDQLLELALDLVYGEAVPPAGEEGPGVAWRLRAAAFAAGFRAAARRHPWCVRLFGDYPSLGPNAVRINGLVTGILTQAALPEEEIQPAIATFVQFVVGVAVTEATWTARFADAEQEAAYHREVTERIAAAGAWPEGVPFPAPDFDVRAHREQDFAFGLEVVLDGLEARAARGRAPAPDARPPEPARSEPAP